MNEKEAIRSALESIQNPLSGQTLKEEKRIISISEDQDKLIFTYNREGIDPKAKRKIEENVVVALSSYYLPENIMVTTVSKDSRDVYTKPESSEKTKPQQQSAQLKTGHGPSGVQKKRVSGVKSVIAISSGKGGVGKSTVAVNLALSLKNLGHKVGILDADVYGPSVPMLLGKRDAKPVATEQKKIAPIEAHGVRFISFGLFVQENEAVIWRGPMLGGVLNQFLFDVDWGELDYLLIDLPPGTGDMQLSLVQATEIDGAIVVSTPQNVALLDTVKGLQMFKKVNVPIIGMLENMSYFAPDDSDTKYYIFGKGGVETTAKELETNYLGGLPLEMALRESSDIGLPYMGQEKFKGRAAWNAYMQVAEKIDNIVNKSNKTKSLLGRLFSK